MYSTTKLINTCSDNSYIHCKWLAAITAPILLICVYVEYCDCCCLINIMNVFANGLSDRISSNLHLFIETNRSTVMYSVKMGASILFNAKQCTFCVLPAMNDSSNNTNISQFRHMMFHPRFHPASSTPSLLANTLSITIKIPVLPLSEITLRLLKRDKLLSSQSEWKILN